VTRAIADSGVTSPDASRTSIDIVIDDGSHRPDDQTVTPESLERFQVHVIQTDNGPELGSSFHHHVLDKWVGHLDSKPRTQPYRYDVGTSPMR